MPACITLGFRKLVYLFNELMRIYDWAVTATPHRLIIHNAILNKYTYIFPFVRSVLLSLSLALSVCYWASSPATSVGTSHFVALSAVLYQFMCSFEQKRSNTPMAFVCANWEIKRILFRVRGRDWCDVPGLNIIAYDYYYYYCCCAITKRRSYRLYEWFNAIQMIVHLESQH